MLVHRIKADDWLLFGKDIRVLITHITQQEIFLKIKMHNTPSRKCSMALGSAINLKDAITLTLKSIEDQSASVEITAPPGILVRLA